VEYKFPPHVALWMLSFLAGREQYVKVGNCVSDVASSHAGAPQGTRAGPNVFKVLINDLKCKAPTLKYVDDVSMVSVASEFDDPGFQVAANELKDWSSANGMTINLEKTEELLIYFVDGHWLHFQF